MKRNAAIVTVSIFLISIYSCNTKTKSANTNSISIYKSENTDSFNLAFDGVLNEYNNLKTAFINWDTIEADRSASILQNLLINVPYEQLKDEDAATKATSIAQNAGDAILTLLTQDSINNKRRIFYTVSESIYNLAKTVGYDNAVIYHKKCPMAFNGEQEGWWFSSSKKIDNPYFGNKHPKYKNAMLECGTVEDSINNIQ